LFNIVFALYIFLSQLAVFGIHLSVLRYVSAYALQDARKADAAVAGGLFLTLCVSVAVALLAWLATPLLAAVYQMPGIRTAWLVLLPALVCFSLNKVLLAAINGAEHMRAFAVFQALRYALILAALVVLLLARVPAELIAGVITIAEALLLPALLWYAGRVVRRWDWSGGLEWLRTHLAFGARVFVSGVIGELNTRVDVLMIGAMLSGASAGIYSVALLLAEGLAQAVVVVRNNLNPLLTRLTQQGAAEELGAFGRRVSGWFALFMAGAGLVLVLGFALTVQWLFSDPSFAGATMPLAILVLCLALAAPYMPFGMILSQSGRPLMQTLFSLAVLGCNVVLNYLLIPVAGINGAALGTGLSFIVTALLLLVILRRVYGVRIWV
jgi:O-antigen/teichoic acid export membrane protein